MPLPIILGIAAGIAAVGGVGSGISGAVKMKDANDTMESAKRKMENSQDRVKRSDKEATASMDKLGTLELNILSSFQEFSDIIERIQNRPQFKDIEINGVKLPKYDPTDIKKVSIGAGVLAGGLGGAALGTAGGFAAAGATTAAVMALGTASTGTAIASLSGAAATNATLAALGGGAIAAGGGGIALGTTILGASTLGVGLLVGGVIFNITGSKLSDKADEAWRQAKKAEEEADRICKYLNELKSTADNYERHLERVNGIYSAYLNSLKLTVMYNGKTDWNMFTDTEKKTVENTVMLVALLYEMCKVKLVLKSDDNNVINKVNYIEVDHEIGRASAICDKVA